MNTRFLQFFPRATWAAPLALATWLGMASQASALECPAPQTLSRPGVLKETPTQVAVVAKLLESAPPNVTVPLIEADLRARYPGVENAEIVNYVITAYCPVVNDMRVSDADKQARMSRFAHDLMAMIY
jgi:hypothetical protein